jgi:hypothetical protein
MNDLNSTWFAVTNVAEDPALRQHRNPLLRAFAEHLGVVAMALWALHKYQEGDLAQEEAEEAIRACLGPGATLEVLTADARRIVAELGKLLEETNGPD